MIAVRAGARFVLGPPPPRRLPELDCGGCRKCCEGDQVILEPGDNAALWRTQDLADGQVALARNPDGNCVYLGPDGCTIHDRTRPAKCARFDCRVYYLLLQRDPAALAARLNAPNTGSAVREGQHRMAEIRKSIANG